jgi:hypothetical protein
VTAAAHWATVTTPFEDAAHRHVDTRHHGVLVVLRKTCGGRCVQERGYDRAGVSAIGMRTDLNEARTDGQ